MFGLLSALVCVFPGYYRLRPVGSITLRCDRILSRPISQPLDKQRGVRKRICVSRWFQLRLRTATALRRRYAENEFFDKSELTVMITGLCQNSSTNHLILKGLAWAGYD